MSSDSVFLPIDIQRLEERLESFSSEYDLVVVTLTSGDVLLGAISKHWDWNERTVSLSFNTEAGQRFQFSHEIDIPVELIADTEVVPLDEASAPRRGADDPQARAVEQIFGESFELDPRLPVRDYPNPLATIICKHNAQIAQSHNLPVNDCAEFSLPLDAIPPEGISFDDEFLLYADWPFFQRQISGSSSITGGIIPNILEINKDLSQPLQQYVFQKLKVSLGESKVRRGTELSDGMHIIQGHIVLVESEMTTDIEGEKCHICIVGEIKRRGELRLVLLKNTGIKLPIEFVGCVNSILSFYGEVLPIPVNVQGRNYQHALLARAVGFLP
jgi:hypothetical protein